MPASWHPLARQELFEASAFYEAESEGLGAVFLNAVYEALGRVQGHPRAGREVLPGIRSYLVALFPYSLLYRIDGDPEEDQIFILAVAHQRRRPRYWAERT